MSLSYEEARKYGEARNLVDALKTLYPAARETLDNIEAAVESSIPKEPLFREDSDKTYCPGCKHPISRYTKGHGNHEVSFCKWCGQRIDWSVLDEDTDEDTDEEDTYDADESGEENSEETDKSGESILLKELMAAFNPNRTDGVKTVVVKRFRRPGNQN